MNEEQLLDNNTPINVYPFPSPSEIKTGYYWTIVLHIPLLGALLSLFVGLIPYKKISFRHKYPRFLLVCIMFMSSMGCLLFLVSLIQFRLDGNS